MLEILDEVNLPIGSNNWFERDVPIPQILPRNKQYILVIVVIDTLDLNNVIVEVDRVEIWEDQSEPTGACCVWESCSVVTANNCASMGGNYFGNNISCEIDTCWDEDGVLNVPNEYPDIQTAINMSVDTDLILIEAGTYYPSSTINTQGKAITIRGAVDGNGAPTTILDGQGNKQVIRCVNGEGFDTIFENLVISGGAATTGGGMFNNDSSPTLTNCTFESNIADNTIYSYGGGMYNWDNSSPTLTCTTGSIHRLPSLHCLLRRRDVQLRIAAPRLRTAHLIATLLITAVGCVTTPAAPR